jgi:hypothetical protein
LTSSWTGCWPRSTVSPASPSPGPSRSRCSRTGEAFLAPLQAAGLPQQQTALAFSLIYDYTLGFALSDRTTTNEQRVQDTATRRQLHAFFRSLPADRFPALAALGERIWADNRDQRFTASLDTLLSGIETARRRSGRQPRR